MNIEELIEQSNRQETTQFKASIVRYLKKWPWIALCVLLTISLNYARLKFVAKQYNVEGTVLIKKSSTAQDPSDILFGSRYQSRFTGVVDEVIIFKSFPLIKDALKSLKFDVVYKVDNGFVEEEIYQDKPFVFEFDRENNKTGIPKAVQFNIKLLDENKFEITTEIPFDGKTLNQVGAFDETIQLGEFSFVIQKTSKFEQSADYQQNYRVYLNTIENITYTYRQKLKFGETESFSKILTMSMHTASPQKAIDFINTLIEKYIEQDLIDKNKASKNTVEFIDEQLAVISDSLNNKERNLETFKSSAQMSELSIEGKLFFEKYNQIESEKAQYEVMQQYYDYLETNLKSGESNLNNLIAPSAFGITDLMINDLVKSLLELTITENNLIREGNTKSPLLEQVQNRKNAVISALEESIKNLSKANLIILANLNRRADEINASAQRLPNTERQLVNLNRLLKLNENIYLFLMEKRSSAAIAMSANTPDCKVIEPAMLNPLRPISPNTKMAYLIAVILGIFIPLLIIIAIDLLNDIVKSKEDIEAATNTPIMGLIPKGKKDGVQFVAIEKPKSVLAESFRIIRTNLSFFQKDKHPFVIMVTSTVAKEGKTFCAINLASILAASGKKTILLGFDLRKPQIHNYLNLENTVGISNYLTKRAALDEIIMPSKQENLFIINSGNIPPNPSELLIGDQTEELITKLKQQFDYIILDTPPMGIVADALILKEHSDLNLYVVRQGFSKRDFVNRINELFVSGKIPHLSLLINDASGASTYGSGYYEEDASGSFIQKLIRLFKGSN